MPRTRKPPARPAVSPRTARATRASKTPGPTNGHVADSDVIARRAYEIYQHRGAYHGADLDDWLEAERQVTHGADVARSAVSPKPRRRKVT